MRVIDSLAGFRGGVSMVCHKLRRTSRGEEYEGCFQFFTVVSPAVEPPKDVPTSVEASSEASEERGEGQGLGGQEGSG